MMSAKAVITLQRNDPIRTIVIVHILGDPLFLGLLLSAMIVVRLAWQTKGTGLNTLYVENV